jgi:hypothetical protein
MRADLACLHALVKQAGEQELDQGCLFDADRCVGRRSNESMVAATLPSSSKQAIHVNTALP